MNIAMFTNVYKPFVGGVPISIERLAKGLRDIGHNVYVFAPDYPDKDVEEDDVIRCKLITFYSNKKFDIPVVDVFSKDLKDQFLKLDIDIVHVHHPFWMGTRGIYLSKLTGVPVLFTYHTRYEEYLHNIPLSSLFISKKVNRKQGITGTFMFKNYLKYKIVPTYVNHFIKKCSGVIFPTDSMTEWVGQIDKPKYILPTGLEDDAYIIDEEKSKIIRQKHIGDKEHLFVSVSRITKEKNIDFMVKALNVLKQKIGDSFKLMIVGSGDLIDDLNALADSMGVRGNVEFVGQVDNDELPAYYGASDLFLFASLTETQGIVLLEAMAQGVPAVAINATGVRDLIENGKNGYLCTQNKNDWCRHIIMAMDNKELRKGAIETAREYTCEKIAKRAAGIYLQAIDDYKQKNGVNFS